jgi:uncharacterized protein (DUF1800 family)
MKPDDFNNPLLSAMTEKQKIAHLYRRSGFGLSIRESATGSLQDAIEHVLNRNQQWEELFLQGEERVTTGKLIVMSPEDRKEIIQDLAANVKKLNLEWIRLMGKAEGQLREKMALFFHGHFAVRVRKFHHVEDYINTIRKHALGYFGDMLMAVSKEPAMLRFLDNVQNKKNSPNENFAREVMELFTLGRGNYTENDIKEAARAFTGWGISDEDEFELKDNQHDSGTKTVFGKTGNWEGEDVIRMILEQPQTAYFVARKVYKFFVSEQVDEQRIKMLSDIFFKSNYHIPTLMKVIFSADWFYDEKQVGCLIKSPVELIVSLNRTFGISYANSQPLLAVQRVLGQTLFFPPNVAGWAGGRNWIDNSTLITRLNLPKRLAEAGELDLSYKNNMDDENPNEAEKPRQKKTLECSFNWELFLQKFESIPETEHWKTLCELLLVGTIYLSEPDYLLKFISGKSHSEKLKQQALYITRTPEFQLV